MSVVARCAGSVALLVAATLIAGAVQAGPLGIGYGDEISSIEWDALAANGEGAVYTAGTGDFAIDGRFNSVDLVGPSTLPVANVSMRANLAFFSELLTFPGNFPTNPNVGVDIRLVSAGDAPDVVIKENGINILMGNFTSQVRATGSLNVLDSAAVLVAAGKITFTGGNGQLLNALGGAGVGQANVILRASLFDFDPQPINLLQTGPGVNQLFDNDFNLSLSGTLTPLNTAPFVPEPSTALLVGGGLVVLLGISRRAQRRA